MSKSEGMDVVASRVIDLKSADRSSRLVLDIGRPTFEEPDGSWACRIRLSGPDVEVQRQLYGQDSLQVMMLAISLADTEIGAISASTGMAAFWLGEQIPPVFAELEGLNRLKLSLESTYQALQAACSTLEDSTAAHNDRLALAHRLTRVIESVGVVDLDGNDVRG